MTNAVRDLLPVVAQTNVQLYNQLRAGGRSDGDGAFARELGTPDVKAISRMLGALLDDPAAARDLAGVEQAARSAWWYGRSRARSALRRARTRSLEPA